MLEPTASLSAVFGRDPSASLILATKAIMSVPGAINALPIIIVGGGPVGLITAHTLHAADIDCMVLEGEESVVEDKGTSLILYAYTFIRVSHRLGFFKDVLAAASELYHRLSFTKVGHVY
ncbi:hypothetical protein F5Y18DRAFT_439755 [Xylariaceae sp. FL1019]|nr:hypothetical protein F5Y18DRAFT_439755 [Xylariaceae sp. FL1019]